MTTPAAPARPPARPAPRTPAARPPASVQAARLALCVVGATHLAVPLVLLLGGAPLSEHTTAQALALHLPLLVLVTILVAALPTGSRWARRPTTVAMTLSTIFALALWNAPITVPALTTVAVAAQATVVTLLWTITSARRFFTTNSGGAGGQGR